jgi:hypothetical protein
MKKKKTFKGDDLRKTAQDRKLGGAKYEPWEQPKASKRKKRPIRRSR